MVRRAKAPLVKSEGFLLAHHGHELVEGPKKNIITKKAALTPGFAKAQQREAQIKGCTRNKKLALIE